MGSVGWIGSKMQVPWEEAGPADTTASKGQGEPGLGQLWTAGTLPRQGLVSSAGREVRPPLHHVDNISSPSQEIQHFYVTAGTSVSGIHEAASKE